MFATNVLQIIYYLYTVTRKKTRHLIYSGPHMYQR